MRRVRGSGDLASRIVVVAEAPGEWEEKIGLPLVGPSGQRLDSWWAGVGLGREMMRLENVVEVRPPGNKLEALGAGEIDNWIADLHQRAVLWSGVTVIAAVGNLALRALTGKTQITKWRSSILSYVDLNGRRIKVVPTIHPAATFRDPAYAKRCITDWKRIAEESKSSEIVLPQRTHITRPTMDQVEEFATTTMKSDQPLSIDIETPHGMIGCVGFSYDPAVSLTIPTMSYWKKYESAMAWFWVRELCEGPNEKVLQNGFFDAYWLRVDKGIELERYRWDTLAMHHCLDAADDHDLAYLASVYTRQHYWKDEAKDPESIKKYASVLDALWVYNGIDACVQRELRDTLYALLVERGLTEFYDRHYARVFPALLDLMSHGIRVDRVRQKRHLTKLIVERLSVEKELSIAAGMDLHVNNGVSAQRLLKYMKTVGVKPFKKLSLAKLERVETTDEASMRRLIKKYPKFAPVGQLVLRHRSVKKDAEFFENDRFDADDRMRSTYKVTTTTGRLSSSANPKGTGANAQNIDRQARWMFLPDEGCVFVEVDLSQAESRAVGVMTGDPELIELANMPPGEFDIHTYNAAIVFGVLESLITPEQRYLGKRGVHASNYGMAGDTLSDQLAKEGIFVHASKCQAMIDRYHTRFPAIRGWQREVRATVLREGRLVNSWGRVYDVSHMHLNDEAYRQCYASGPQSEVIDWINQYGLVPTHAAIRGRALRAHINVHCHDSLLLSVPKQPKLVHQVMTFLHDALEVTPPGRVLANGHTMKQFVEFKVGPAWGKGSTEFKRLPSLEAVTAVLEAA